MKTVLKYIILLMALGLAGTVAFVSVSGLLKLFAGAGLFGAILFWAMEVSKIVLTSAIHTYSKIIKWYYKIASIVLILLAMVITSIGIYGFYSSSYKESFANMTAVGNRVALIEEKRNLIIADKELMKEQIDSKRERIKDQSSIRGQQETRMDSLYAKNWYTAARRVQKSIDEANTNITKLEGEIDVINKGIGVINDSLTSYNLQIIELNQNNSAATELGSLTYLSDVTNMTMDNVMKWFILLIMILGDPLAVLLVVLFNIINKRGKDDAQSDAVSDAQSDAVNDVVKDITESVSKLPKYENPPQPPAPKDYSDFWGDKPSEVEDKLEDKNIVDIDLEPVGEEYEGVEPSEVEDKLEDKVVWEEPKEDGSKYVLGFDPVSTGSTTVFKIDENENFVKVGVEDKRAELRAELPSELDESKSPEVIDNEGSYEVEQRAELRAESDTTKRYKLDIEDLPKVESDKVNRYNVELPTQEVNIEEKDDDKYWLEDMDSETEEKVIPPKTFIKGKAIRNHEGYKAEVELPEEDKELSEDEKKEVVKEILDKKKTNRGFSKNIPERKIDKKNVIVRKRRNKR